MEQSTITLNLKWKDRMTGQQLGHFFLAQSINRLPVDQRPDAIRTAINNRS